MAKNHTKKNKAPKKKIPSEAKQYRLAVLNAILTLILTAASVFVAFKSNNTTMIANEISERALQLERKLSRPTINVTHTYDEETNQIRSISISNDGGIVDNYDIKIVPCFRTEYEYRTEPGSPFPYDLFVTYVPIVLNSYIENETYAPICRLIKTEARTGLLGSVTTSASIADYVDFMNGAITASNAPESPFLIRSISLEYYIRIVYNDMEREQSTDYYRCVTGCYTLNDRSDVALPKPAAFERIHLESDINDIVKHSFYYGGSFNPSLAAKQGEDMSEYLYHYIAEKHDQENSN